MPIIEVKNLSFSYSERKITLKNLNFKIEKGTFVSVVGHNGSGKSTLAKVLIGLLHQNSGEIIIDGDVLTKQNLSAIRSKIALVFQNPDNQFIGQTVEDDIAFSLENKCVSSNDMPELVKKYATEVGMEDFLNKEPTLLSGGQKQRVAIASALALKPKILILDEATAMLDPKGKKDIHNIIHSLRETNPDITILCITHDIEEALLSDEILILDEGTLVASGKTKEILKNKQDCEKYRINIPFIFELKDQMSKVGINLDNCDSIKDVVEVLCQYK